VRPLLRILAAARRLLGAAALAALALEGWNACKQQGADGNAKGRVLYAANCTACHNPDPSKDGSLGPALKGSPLELVQARVLRGEYPPGYSPKRQTRIMQKLPLTEEDVAAIHAFLNAP
jgi:mono/diheme cytochrome c family protein